jgi:hypothetical protein
MPGPPVVDAPALNPPGERISEPFFTFPSPLWPAIFSSRISRCLNLLPFFEPIMIKESLLARIIARLEADHALQLQAAKTAHAAATHEENIPDNKYDTLGLEASYIAQGHANRAQETLSA